MEPMATTNPGRTAGLETPAGHDPPGFLAITAVACLLGMALAAACGCGFDHCWRRRRWCWRWPRTPAPRAQRLPRCAQRGGCDPTATVCSPFTGGSRLIQQRRVAEQTRALAWLLLGLVALAGIPAGGPQPAAGCC